VRWYASRRISCAAGLLIACLAGCCSPGWVLRSEYALSLGPAACIAPTAVTAPCDVAADASPSTIAATPTSACAGGVRHVPRARFAPFPRLGLFRGAYAPDQKQRWFYPVPTYTTPNPGPGLPAMGPVEAVPQNPTMTMPEAPIPDSVSEPVPETIPTPSPNANSSHIEQSKPGAAESTWVFSPAVHSASAGNSRSITNAPSSVGSSKPSEPAASDSAALRLPSADGRQQSGWGRSDVK